MTVELDHVVYAACDLAATEKRFRRELGLNSVEGGVHPRGTLNRVAWCGDGSYVELIGVHNAALPLGAWLDRHLHERGDGLVAWAVRTDDIEAVGARLGARVEVGSIASADGTTGSWRTVGSATAMSQPCFPFFIQYDEPRSEPRAAAAARLAWIEVSGDTSAIHDWLAEDDLPVRTAEGVPAHAGVSPVIQ